MTADSRRGASLNRFVQINVKIAPGRPEAVVAGIRDSLVDAASIALAPMLAAGPSGFQVEISEFRRELTASRNNMMQP
ncbi:hypothetical protein ACXIUS_21645 [Bosea thiooxidans]